MFLGLAHVPGFETIDTNGPDLSGAHIGPMVLFIDDQKAVFTTVRSKDRIEARVCTPGTV